MVTGALDWMLAAPHPMFRGRLPLIRASCASADEVDEVLLGFHFHGLTGLKLGVTDGGIAHQPLVFLFLDEGFSQRFAHVVAEPIGDFRLRCAFQFWRERDVHGWNVQRLAIFVKMGDGCGSEGARLPAKSASMRFLNHFPDLRKMVQIGSQWTREVADVMFSLRIPYVRALDSGRREKLSMSLFQEK